MKERAVDNIKNTIAEETTAVWTYGSARSEGLPVDNFLLIFEVEGGILPESQVQITKCSGVISKDSCFLWRTGEEGGRKLCVSSVSRFSFGLLLLEGFGN